MLQVTGLNKLELLSIVATMNHRTYDDTHMNWNEIMEQYRVCG